MAHTDPDHTIASGLTTVATDRAIDFLQDYHKSTPVEKFVVGQPKQKDGNFSDVEKDILMFIKHLETFFPTVSVVRQDERFTSKMAFNSLLETGAKKRPEKTNRLLTKSVLH